MLNYSEICIISHTCGYYSIRLIQHFLWTCPASHHTRTNMHIFNTHTVRTQHVHRASSDIPGECAQLSPRVGRGGPVVVLRTVIQQSRVRVQPLPRARQTLSIDKWVATWHSIVPWAGLRVRSKQNTNILKEYSSEEKIKSKHQDGDN
jgi:hypothetical protein